MTRNITDKQRAILKHMWDCWFARSMTLTDFSRRTVGALEQSGLIAWDAEADAMPGASGPAKFGLTYMGFSVCEREFGPRKTAAEVRARQMNAELPEATREVLAAKGMI